MFWLPRPFCALCLTTGRRAWVRFEVTTFANALPKREASGQHTPLVCLGNGNSNRLVSLWDIVRQFHLLDLVAALHKLTALETSTEMLAQSKPGTIGTPFLPALDLLTESIYEECVEADFKVTRSVCYSLRLKLGHAIRQGERQTGFSVAHVQTECRHIRESLKREIFSRKFLAVAESRSAYVDALALFGEKVKEAFPSAAFDIREAGNCMAAECYTAAVFHLMRTVEWGLRALGADLGVRRLRSRIKATGKSRYTPMSWSEWEKAINAIRGRVAERSVKLKRGAKKQAYQEFYNPAVDRIERFKDAFRNHVMHTRRNYESSEADAAFDQVRHFMMQLAERISEC